MASFGERLKREREMRNVSLEEIAESTKIGKRNLLALETEEFNKLPGGIFNKGFVRAYAKYLGLDEDQAVTDFLDAENAASTRRFDAFNRTLMAGPIIILSEVGILCARIFGRRPAPVATPATSESA